MKKLSRKLLGLGLSAAMIANSFWGTSTLSFASEIQSDKAVSEGVSATSEETVNSEFSGSQASSITTVNGVNGIHDNGMDTSHDTKDDATINTYVGSANDNSISTLGTDSASASANPASANSNSAPASANPTSTNSNSAPTSKNPASTTNGNAESTNTFPTGLSHTNNTFSPNSSGSALGSGRDATSSDNINSTSVNPSGTEDGKKVSRSFDETKSVGNAEISVEAGEGVFPADSHLVVRECSVKEKKSVDEAMAKIHAADDRTVVASYTFDVAIHNQSGDEIEPKTEKGEVSISFDMKEAASQNLRAEIYHITEVGSGTLKPEKLDSKVSDSVVEAVTDGFSYYTVEFTYNKLQYVMQGGTEVALVDILSKVGLIGEVTDAKSSNAELFSLEKREDKWFVVAKQAFSSTEKLIVTIGGVDYEIQVTDDPGSGSSGAWDGTSQTVVVPVDGVYTIDTVEKLAWFGKTVRSGSTYADCTVIITGDFNLNRKTWTPISGTLLGKVSIVNCKISGFTLENKSDQISNDGLFGKIIVRNFSIDNMQFASDTWLSYLGCWNNGRNGCVAGYLLIEREGTVSVKNSIFRGFVNGWTTIGDNNNLGTVFGMVSPGANSIIQIENVESYVNHESGCGFEGGIIGYYEDKAHASTLRLKKVKVNAYIYEEGSKYRGAIVGGFIGKTDGGKICMEQCSYQGSLRNKKGDGYAGGLIGYAKLDELHVTDTYVDANISSEFSNWYGATYNGGGFLGAVECEEPSKSSIERCFFSGKFNSGVAFVAHDWTFEKGTIPIYNSYFNMTTSGLKNYEMYGISKYGSLTTESLTNCKGLTSEQMLVYSNYKDWNFKRIWGMGDKYPILQWQDSGAWTDKQDISLATVTLSKESFEYDGTEKKPRVIVRFEDKTLVENEDYSLTYKDNTNPGAATVEVKGINDYTGSATKGFRINDTTTNPPAFHAVIVNGIHGENTAGSDNDAAMMLKALSNNKLDKYSVKAENINTVTFNNTNDPVTVELFNRKTRAAFGITSSKDLSVFYFTGHSTWNKDNGEKLGLSLGDEYYKWNELAAFLAENVEGKIIVVLDACFSESFVKKGIETLDKHDKERFAAICSSAEDEFSYSSRAAWNLRYGNLYYGRLTFALCEGLGCFDDKMWADGNDNGEVTVWEWYEYALRKISANTMSVKWFGDDKNLVMYQDEKNQINLKTTVLPFFSDYNGGKIDVNVEWDLALLDNNAKKYNSNMALASVCLSNLAYHHDEVVNALSSLGLGEITAVNGNQSNDFLHPLTYFGYKRTALNAKTYNIFTVVIRGTTPDGWDLATDAIDGLISRFRGANSIIKKDLESFMTTSTGKTIDEIKNEDNIFFITGHSLGGATANLLGTSLEEYANAKHVFTYTFESPHTKYLLDGQSKAVPHNLINTMDFVPNLPPGIGASTFGNNYFFTSDELNNSIFDVICKGGDVKKISASRGITAYHSLDLDLVAIIEDCIPSHQNTFSANYVKKIIKVACPVDIKVITSKGLIGETKANIANNYKPDIAQIIVKNEEKYVFLNEDLDYEIQFEGTAKGSMNYEILRDDSSSGITLVKRFENVSLTKGKKMISSFNAAEKTVIKLAQDIRLFVIDGSGRKIKTIRTNGEEISEYLEGEDVSAVNDNNKNISSSQTNTNNQSEKGDVKQTTGSGTTKGKVDPDKTESASVAFVADRSKGVNSNSTTINAWPIGKNASKGFYVKTGKHTVRYESPGLDYKIKSATIPATIKYGNKVYKVSSIAAFAFTGYDSLTHVVVGKNIKRISRNAFSGCNKLKKIAIKSRLLKRQQIKGSFSNSSIKTVIVPSGKVEDYKKIFTKRNTGARGQVTVEKSRDLTISKGR